jgi:hypothetical protein
MMTRRPLTTPVFTTTLVLPTLATLLAVAAAHANVPPDPSQKSLKPAVKKYLEEKGNFCLGKFEWPIAVSDEDRRLGTTDALQMPVLEKLGLVVAAASPGDPTVKDYSLTDEGKKYYLSKRTITVNSAGQKISHPGDLCPAKLKLDKVVSWDPPSVVDGKAETHVKFTYQITQAAPWAQDPEVRRAFPMVAKILDSAGSQQLMQLFVWSGYRWVALTLGD